MTNTIQIKRRNSGVAGAPTSLASGEPAWNNVDNTLYLGVGDNGSGIATGVAKIGGPGAFVLATALGVASGVATLDTTGKLVASQLPASITGAMVYQTTWNAATNTPSLISGQGNKGFWYKVSAVGLSVNTTAASAVSSGATALTVASASNIVVGNLVAGSNIAAGTIVAALAGTTVTLSIPTTGSVANGAALTFASYLDGVSGAQFQIGDSVIFDGATWDKIDGPAEAVTSVAGRIGAITLSITDVAGGAPSASPALTGVPTAPTPGAGTNSTQLATTGFVAASFMTTSAAQATYAPLASPALSGTPTAPTASVGTATTQLATTAFVAGSFLPAATAASTYAPLVSPALTGSPTAPTPTAGDSTTKLATTGFVAASFATLSSPALTGTPTAPTAAPGNATTQLATTAFVTGQGFVTAAGASTAAPVQSIAGRTGAITLSSTDLTDGTNTGRGLVKAASVTAARAVLNIDARKSVSDANYLMAAADYNVQYTTLTASRTVGLTAAVNLTAGAEVQFGDVSGACSSTITITLNANGSDTINGASSYTIGTANGQVCLQCDGSSKWTVVAQTVAAPTNIDGGSY